MGNISTYSTTAGGNNQTPPDGWPEGQARNTVNDCAREDKAATARWYRDVQGQLVTTGINDNYTLATNSNFQFHADLSLLTFRVHANNNGGGVLLSVDNLMARSLVKLGGEPLEAGDLVTDQIVEVAYNSTADRFELLSTPNVIPAANVSGVKVVECTAIRRYDDPTGNPHTWTKPEGFRYAFVHANGGGGPGDEGDAGGASNFGTHCVANGGQAPSGGVGGAGGTGGTGDVTVDGGAGNRLGGSESNFKTTTGGDAPGPFGGQGGTRSTTSPNYAGIPYGGGASGGQQGASPSGGAGEYATALVTNAMAGETEDINVGAGGTEGFGRDGADGVVVVYEYTLVDV